MAQIELWIEGQAKLVIYDAWADEKGMSVEILVIDRKPRHSLKLDTLTQATLALKKELVKRSINALTS